MPSDFLSFCPSFSYLLGKNGRRGGQQKETSVGAGARGRCWSAELWLWQGSGHSFPDVPQMALLTAEEG